MRKTRLTSLIALGMLAVIMIPIIGLSGCSQTTPAERKIEGTWEYDISFGGKTYASTTYTFNYFGEYVFGVHFKTADGVEDYIGTYEIDGDEIVFNIRGGGTIRESYRLKGETLIIDGKEYTKK